jgi:hypothetical protein
MQEIAHRLSLAFAAGCVGIGVKLLVVAISGHFGLASSLGLAASPMLGGTATSMRLLLGGLWGLLLATPWNEDRYLVRVLLLAAAVTVLTQLVSYLPDTHKLVIGIHLGLRPFIANFISNTIWAAAAAGWYRWIR